MLRFDLLHTEGLARRGRLHTAHGTVETPVFMAVGTQATVKGLTPEQLDAAGVQVVLGNTYHLALRPGDEIIAAMGGLHRFMNWHRPILTDSGGYQIYSLGKPRTPNAATLAFKITDAAAVFRSHIDGSLLELSPEKAVRIQENLGSDIAMCLDECPPFDTAADYQREAVRRTLHWAERCQSAQRRPDQALFAIVQGGIDLDLRAECAAGLVALDFPGYALGGFSVGETAQQMMTALEPTAALLPAAKPRYLMGVGRPEDILLAVARGVDMFDCVLPTRNGRNAMAFTAHGTLRLRNAMHKRDSDPLESDCPCPTCRNYSRAYLHHLFLVDEMLGPTLVSLHNLAYYSRLMADIRQAIEEARFGQFCAVSLARLGARL
ncbi:MAG TPA: tRNA guanosine(34) transglycosylase Tgt [Gemmataceae bacterium]|nr:tRNA guanosine(34) transglycosylase Tgt [Gemmataceae bacterium]